MMRILLISTYEMGRQPFGLASPAAWLRRAGHQVSCVDCAIQPFPVGEVSQSGFIGFFLPMYTATRLAVSLIRRARALNPLAHICAYGLYAPVNSDWLRSLGVNSILGGEYEAGLTELCNRLQDRQPAGDIAAISLQRQQFVLPDRSDLPAVENYARLCSHGCADKITGYTQTTRGCLHTCRHCPIVPVYNGQFRIIQADIVLQDIRQQVAAGAQHLTFGDPDFFNGPGHVLPIVRQLNREFPDVSYDVTIKVENLLKYQKYLAVLSDTNCAFVTSAVEALDDDILTRFDKGHTRADFLQAVELLDAAALPLNPTFVAFTPWTTLQIYRDMLQSIAELGLIENLSPVQLAIRLLIPAGSRLLELEDTRDWLQPYDSELLGYRWHHPDPRVDALQEQQQKQVERTGLSRRDYFLTAWDSVNAALEERHPLPESRNLRPRAAVPYLNEPWYC